MVDPRAKGARTETAIRDLLRKHTGLQWERVPGVEAKGYKDDHFDSSLLTSKNPQLIEFWIQSVRQGIQVKKKPLLVFKHDRSKVFAAFTDMPTTDAYRWVFCNIMSHEFYVALLEDWLIYEKPKFVT
jgi:hypothetical protein